MSASHRRCCWIIPFFVAAVFAFAPPLATARIWTDDQGRKVDADLVRVSDGKVVLRVLATGQEHAQPLAKLSKADQEFVIHRLIMSLRNRNPDTRDQAVNQLVGIGLDAVPALIEEADHKNGGKGSMEALEKIGEPAIPHILRHGEREWREEKGRRDYPLNQLLLRLPAQVVLAAVQREKEEVRIAFVHVLLMPPGLTDEQFGFERRLDLVAGMVDDPSDLVLRAVFECLISYDPFGTRPAVIHAFRRELTSPDPLTRILAARGLCVPKQTGLVPRDHDACKEVLDTIEDVLTKPQDHDVRGFAARQFEYLRVDKAMVPGLKKWLASREPEISAVAAKQLANLGPDAVDAVPDLIKVLQAPKVAQAKAAGRRPTSQTPQSRQRVAAVGALSAIGLSQPDVVDVLLAAAGDSDQHVCSAIISAFRDADLVPPDARNRLTEAIMGNTELDEKSQRELCDNVKTIK
ncbi:MAG: hypothetical protein H8E44_40665 [Planctomycetes bacterium]|nr:hypothetical protein [Planctomycetota bacterium]MBL7041204.1 hypothetical protein [Pirellulaceae bacterium]